MPYIYDSQLLISAGSNGQTQNWFKLDRLNVELTQTLVCLPKPNFEPIWTLSKSPNFEDVQPEMARTKEGQIQNNQTSNSSEPGSSTKAELQIHPNPPKIPNFEPTNCS